MGQSKVDDTSYDDEYANRRGRRHAHRHIRKWVGEVDDDLLSEFEDEEDADAPPRFERLRSRRKSRYDE